MPKRFKKLDPYQIQKHAARKAHFVLCGDPAQWRPRSVRNMDGSSCRARKNKLACRGLAQRRAMETHE
jgi:hypothetical protein